MEIDNGTTFAGNTDPEAIQIISFSQIVVARFVRLLPVSFYSWPSMKAALELCTHAYTSPTSACTNKIYNPTINYRSANSNHENCTRGASLGVPGGWCLLGNSAYMDIDMTYMANINGAAIEGKSDMPQYVTLIKFKISNDNVHWYDIDGGKIFEANHDNLNRVILFFSKSYYGRYVRFMPIGWTILPSFRAGVIACIRSDHIDDSGMQVPPHQIWKSMPKIIWAS